MKKPRLCFPSLGDDALRPFLRPIPTLLIICTHALSYATYVTVGEVALHSSPASKLMARVILRRRTQRRLIYGFLIAFGIWLYLSFDVNSPTGQQRGTSRSHSLSYGFPPRFRGKLSCPTLPGASEVLVVLRAGSTELADRFPVHLQTTLRCYPNYLVVSDHEEVFQGQQVIDVLQDVSDVIKETHPDFELWRRLADDGRSALRDEELSSSDQTSQNLKGTEKFGKQTNPGWKLDKWKFLPMLNLTLSRATDDFKWFVFVETDTYLMWQNLLDYLRTFDPQDAWYLGLRYNYTGATFAYGGSGFTVSKPALEKVVKEYGMRKDYWEEFTAGHWAGDAVLGTAFEAAGLDVTVDSSATWMSYSVGEAGYHGLNESFLCARPISYHHMSPEDIQGLWNFEMQRAKDKTMENLRHRDILTEYIVPQMISWPVREHWNNYANSDYGPVDSVAACQMICEGIENCVQYMLSPESRCLLGSSGRLGSRSDQDETAGWMIERMKEFASHMPKCV